MIAGIVSHLCVLLTLSGRIAVHGKVYDCSKFYGKHPGEGTDGMYIYNFAGTECTEIYDKYHYTETPAEWLDQAQKVTSPRQGLACSRTNCRSRAPILRLSTSAFTLIRLPRCCSRQQRQRPPKLLRRMLRRLSVNSLCRRILADLLHQPRKQSAPLCWRQLQPATAST
jgi:hypothetical protein